VSIARALKSLLTSTTASEPVALCRIGVGTAALGRSLKDARDLYLIHHDPSVVPAPMFTWSPSLATPPETVLVGGLVVGAAIALLVGYRARLAAGILTAATAFLYVVDQNFWGHHVYFISLMTLLLTFVESDAALSVRALRGGGRPRVTDWPVLLMKLQLSLVYFFAAVAKLNPVFLSGYVIASRTSLPALARQDPLVLSLLAVAAFAGEAWLSFALWVPRLRFAAIVIGVGMHALVPIIFGMYAGLIVFSVASVSMYPLFLGKETSYRTPRCR
jgi:vitamin K-dependent gamma-carboxylase-like protein